MKKNIMMRLASFLLVAVLISTSAISGTYAKYVTKGKSEDNARVAKFGVVITGDKTMFEERYETTDTAKYTGAYSVETGTAGDKLVAPGTTGNMTAITITGEPEVAVEVKYDATVTLNDKWVDQNGDFYCPLIFTIENGTAKETIDGKAYNNAATLMFNLENAVEKVNAVYGPNTDLAGIDAGANLNITWEWPFYIDDDIDVKDTYLGDQAALDNAGTIDVVVTCTVTQVD